MGWATAYIASLQAGEIIKFRPHGHSMTGIISNGQLVTVRPILESDILVEGDVVLCKVKGRQYLHLIKALYSKGLYLIGNNRGGTNGWTARKNIFGLLMDVEE